MKVDLYAKIVLTAIAIGLFLNVAGDSKLSVVKDASAEVAGKNYIELMTDWDFQTAVKLLAKDVAEDVIEGCKVKEPTGFEGFGGILEGKTIGKIDC